MFKTTAEGSLGKAKLVEEQVAGGKNVRIRARQGETGIKFPAPAGGSEHTLFDLSVSLPQAPQVPSPSSPSTLSPNAPCSARPATSWPRWKRRRPTDRNAQEPGHFESFFTFGMGMFGRQGADFVGIKLKYWAR